MKKRMNYKELSQFYNDLSVFWKSGLPPSQALDTMKKGKKGPKFWMIDGLQHRVSKGESTASGMSRYPDFFDDFQVMIIRGAEESGKMVDTCKNLSNYYEMRGREKKRLIGGMIYPVFLLHAAILLPNLKYLFAAGLDKSYAAAVLPPLIIAYGILAIGYACWKTLFRSGRAREIIDGIFLKLPLVGELAHGLAVSRVFRTLAGLLDAGIESVQAARKAAGTAGNSSIAARLAGAVPVLEHGGNFSGFFTFSGTLNSSQLSMVAIGEEGGQLAETLEKMALYLDEENSRRFTTTVKFFYYSAYFIAAAIVAYTVITFYSSHLNIF
ncbi:MAG: type II secretion system F family protein [Candidatus Aminicenantes bacterium]|nr:type II secretion system F family protein [Candidatus Aminicenantes bacterium]